MSSHQGRRNRYVHTHQGSTEQRAEVAQSENGERNHHEPTNLRAELIDATGYLFLDHVPFTVLSITVLLPLVVGFGGALSTVDSLWIFPVLAFLPVFCMGILIGWLVHQIFLESCHGIIDPPTLSRSPQVLRSAASFLLIVSTCVAVLLAPGVLVIHYVGEEGIAILVAGALMFPVATVLCLSRNDLQGLNPTILFSALARLRSLGLAVTTLTWVMFSPAILAWFFSSGWAEFLRLSLCASLSVAPMVVVARLMGNVVSGNRDRVADLLYSCSSALGPKYDPSVEIYSASRFENQPDHISWEDWSAALRRRADPCQPASWSESGILAKAREQSRLPTVEDVPRPRIQPEEVPVQPGIRQS